MQLSVVRQRRRRTLQQQWSHNVVVVILLLIAIRSMICTTSSSKMVIPLVTADWVSDCKDRGFYPEQLACQTCQLLLQPELIDTCQLCCQNWLDIKRITKPYISAVVIDRGTGGEVETFMKENWDEVMEVKGTHQLHKVHAAKDSFNFFQMRPSQVLFFNDPTIIQNNKVTLDVTQLTQKAVEVVNLDGMKREDMKDMLLTLLP